MSPVSGHSASGMEIDCSDVLMDIIPSNSFIQIIIKMKLNSFHFNEKSCTSRLN